MNRPSKDQYYIGIAERVLARGTCLRRNYGAVIVKDDEIVGTGYTGSSRGDMNCCDTGFCLREENNIAPGEHYELCHSVHAEANAIISAGRSRCLGATIYVVGKNAKTGDFISTIPCDMCMRLIKNAGIIKWIIPFDLE